MRETRLNEAQPASDGSSKLKLIWSNKASYARGHPYTVLHPGTMHASTLLLLLLLRAIAHRLQFHMAPWSFTSSSCLMSSEICLNPNFIHNWPDELGPSILHWLSHYYTGWLQIIFMTGERLTHLTVSVNDLRVSFGLRCLSRSSDFHARF